MHAAMYTLPPLPYAYDALQPFVSRDTMTFHHDVLHANYVHALNRGGLTSEAFDYNLGGNVLHTLLWPSLSPHGGGPPVGPLARMIDREFGGYAALREAMIRTALASQGSGWALLSAERGRLFVELAHNHGTRAQWGRAVLPLDVWEHAYYLDRGPNRRAWCEAFFDRLVDWHVVAGRVVERR